MAKEIHFTYDGKDDTLEYTRRTVQQMETEGFSISKVTETPAISIPMLFAGAFKAHHKWMKPNVIEEIYAQMPNKDKLIERLAEMYNDSLATLMDEPDESAKKVSWETNW